jgi:hypothetical protein
MRRWVVLGGSALVVAAGGAALLAGLTSVLTTVGGRAVYGEGPFAALAP